MKRSDIVPMPEFFDRYILLVDDIDILSAFKMHSPLFNIKELENVHPMENFAYQSGKWTVKEVIQHLTDNDRIQSYRALRISRGDTTPLPGYDQDVVAQNNRANDRNLQDLLEEHATVRTSTIQLFSSMRSEDMLRIGSANGNPITPLALGFQIVGHQIYHKQVLRERYFGSSAK